MASSDSLTHFEQLGGSSRTYSKIEELRLRVQQRLRELRETPQTIPPNPPPRYDEVFARGQQWLEQLAFGPNTDEDAQP